MKDSIRITKVKHSKGRVHVAYQAHLDREVPDEFTLDTSDAPHPDFEKALAALVPHVVEWVELPASAAQRLRVQGVSFSYADDTAGIPVMGATVTALLGLSRSRSPLVVNTPHKPERPYAEGDPDAGDYCLTPDCAEALADVLEEAERYLDGKRAQGSLALDGDAADAGRTDAPSGPAETTSASTARNGGKPITATLTKETGRHIDALLKKSRARKRAKGGAA